MEILNANTKLSVQNLHKSYNGLSVLKDVSFDVREGEFLSVLGPSGCGKTTLLRILIGLEKQNQGTILLDGLDISTKPPHLRDMGIIFQNYALFPNMSVLENVMYAMPSHNVLENKNIAHRILTQINLQEHLQKLPHQLSGGQQQRVAIARTLALQPKVVLLDEPISALDVSNREIMKKELKEIQLNFHSTMIFITHDQEEAFYLSDRIMIMSEGKIEQLDTPQMIYDHPANAYIQEFVVSHLDQKLASLLKCTGKKS